MYSKILCIVFTFIAASMQADFSLKLRESQTVFEEVGSSLHLERGVTDVPSGFNLELEYEIDSPVVDGNTLQATRVIISGNLAFVAYNSAGDERVGAIQAIQMSRRSAPRVLSELIIRNADVNSLTKNGDYLYAALASSDEELSSPAAILAILFNGNEFDLNSQNILPLDSYAATSVDVHSGRIYVTSGSNGHLYTLNRNRELGIIDRTELFDARWVTVEPNGRRRVVALQGIPGQVSTYVYANSQLNFLNSFPLNSDGDVEAKSSLEVINQRAFIALNASGVKIISINTGRELGTVPPPSELGYSLNEVGANALTIDRDLLFIANGTAGINVIQGSRRFSNGDAEERLNLTNLGFFNFDGCGSMNDVYYNNGNLIVAAGLGGVKLVRVNRR